ncbi:MAG: tetratricopeptide repeat protein, partial [Candidatus Blackburnbacteria bacterium]|nr:tetratricopeptide repeat protein [Candidatus Blackburnbacteria bacterium]
LELAASEAAGRKNNLLPWFFALVSLSGLALVLYFGRDIYAGEMAYRRGLNAVLANDGIRAYNSMIEAINKNPRFDGYRISYSQINLALANNIAAKKDLTDQERQTVSQLIQQAIAQAKSGVSLNQKRSENWGNLARIYQSLIPAAQGADQFAIATYQQAIALDPVNPELRIALGGVFYGLGRYEDAARVFELAVAAKPNHANAHYNLASALREKKDTGRAVGEMEQVLQLVDVTSQDYKTAQAELDKLRGKLKEEQEATRAAQPETLKGPSAPTGPEIEPPIALPAESAPPSTESAEPTPIPAPGQ